MLCTSNNKILTLSSWKSILIDYRKSFKVTGVLTASFNESRALPHCFSDFWAHLYFYILHPAETSECVRSTIFVSKKSQICLGFRQWPSRMDLRDGRKKSFFFACLTGCFSAVRCMNFNREWKFKIPQSYLSWKCHFLSFNASLFSTSINLEKRVFLQLQTYLCNVNRNENNPWYVLMNRVQIWLTACVYIWKTWVWRNTVNIS